MIVAVEHVVEDPSIELEEIVEVRPHDVTSPPRSSPPPLSPRRSAPPPPVHDLSRLSPRPPSTPPHRGTPQPSSARPNPAPLEQAFRHWGEGPELAPAPSSIGSAQPVSFAPKSPSYAPAPYDASAGMALNPYAHRSRPPPPPAPVSASELEPAPAGELTYQVYSAREAAMASARPRPLAPTDPALGKSKPSLAAIVCMVLAGVCVVFGTAALVILGTSDDAPTPKTTATMEVPPGFPPPPALDPAVPVVGTPPGASNRDIAPPRTSK